jgi:hypothetical protein
MLFQAFSILPFLFTLLAFPSSGLHTVSANLNSPHPTSVAVVELFTSEGCSSCPPADALLREIHGKQTSDGQWIIGISEHVTYWNSLGWRDPYSAETFTDRQNVYASRFSAEGPYTPQMVLNGREQFVGSDSPALERALKQESRRMHIDLQILSTELEGKRLNLRFALKGTTPGPLDVIAVLTDDVDRSTVLRGENSGRSLQHISVARVLSRVAVVRGDAEQAAYLSIPEGLHLEAGSGHHLVLFAQEPRQGAIWGAATTSF